MTLDVSALIATHGYWIAAAAIGLESMGIPAPGETVLVTAAIYSGTTHHLNIGLLIAAAAFGAIAGDNVGYAIGRRFGSGLLSRHGHLVRLDERRVRLGQFLFARHGGKVVLFGRFVAVLRALAAVLAGVTRMDWWRFFLFNATGGVIWAASYGTAAYVFGERIEQLRTPVAVLGVVIGAVVIAAATWWLRSHEAALQLEADRTMADPLSGSRTR